MSSGLCPYHLAGPAGEWGWARARHITGWILLGLGVAVAAASAIVQVNLYLHAAILAACGVIFLKANPKPRAPKQTDTGTTEDVAHPGRISQAPRPAFSGRSAGPQQSQRR